ncbi:MAG: dethiobiotin synthase [Syntrophomonadaceae bacterium]|nr:dethiobiotin synthase [Syntrophomonadaceae bacterium]
MSYRGYFITGTDTGVGKTVVTAGLLGALRNKNIDAIAIKPMQSGGILDAAFYCATTPLPYQPEELSAICLELPLAPAVAAAEAGIDIDLAKVMDHFHQLAGKHEMVLAEGAGGLLVPLTGTHYTVADLAKDIGLPLLIVARPTLGTINHTCLSVAYARARGLEVAGIIISGYPHENPGLAERTNPQIIAEMAEVPVLGLLPNVQGLISEGEALNPGALVSEIEKHVDLDALLSKADFPRTKQV